MRFLCVYKPVKPEGQPPSPEEMTTMEGFIQEAAQAGVLEAAEGCMPTSMGARVRQSGGKYIVTDGPFTETKEIIGGLAILKCKSKDDAVEWTKRFLKIAGDGETEIRQLYEGPAH